MGATPVGISEAYLCYLEHGDKVNPSLTITRKLARALGVSLSELAE